jgi:enoyl-CoA hydratase/carnithine racemase
MRSVAEAVQRNTVTGQLVSGGSVQDLETAYHACLIEEESSQKIREIAPDLAKRTPEARRMVKRVWKSLRSSKQGTGGTRTREA